jgi:hypothetical protein
VRASRRILPLSDRKVREGSEFDVPGGNIFNRTSNRNGGAGVCLTTLNAVTIQTRPSDAATRAQAV